MRKLSDFLSKPLISLANASFEGTIIGVLCDRKLKSIEYLVILLENEVLDERKYVSVRYVKNTTENSATVSNNLCIKSAEEVDTERFTENPINSSVYDSDGLLIGRLCDLLFSDTTKQILQLDVEGKLVEATSVASTSHDIIIINNNPEKRPYKAPPRKVKKPKDDFSVELLKKDKPAHAKALDTVKPNDQTLSFTENSDTESNVEDAKSEANDISEPIKFAEKSEQINSVTETALENEISGLDNQASSSDVFQPNDFVDFSKENIETVCAACEEDLHFCDAETAIEDLFQASAPLEKDDLTKPDAVLFETGEEFTANQPQDTPIVLSELELDSPPNDDELACADLETQIDLSQQTSDDFDSENEIKISVVSDVKFEELISSLKSKGFDDKLPIRLVSDYRFLLGRTVTNNIYNLRKELIIEKNTQVTVPVVEHALRTGKLIELILNSRPI